MIDEILKKAVNNKKISDDEFFKMNQMLYGTNGTDADYISGLKPRNGF